MKGLRSEPLSNASPDDSFVPPLKVTVALSILKIVVNRLDPKREREKVSMFIDLSFLQRLNESLQIKLLLSIK